MQLHQKKRRKQLLFISALLGISVGLVIFHDSTGATPDKPPPSAQLSEAAVTKALVWVPADTLCGGYYLDAAFPASALPNRQKY